MVDDNNNNNTSTKHLIRRVNPFRTPVPLWGQTTQIPGNIVVVVVVVVIVVVVLTLTLLEPQPRFGGKRLKF